MRQSTWQHSEVARQFVAERRAAIPYGMDQIDMLLRLVERFNPEPKFVADLGCGDGILARAVLDTYLGTHALLLDHSEPMLQQARSAMKAYGERCQVALGDLSEPLSPHFLGRRPDVVVSGYAIHHLPDERKRLLYGDIYKLLNPGGLFVNIEHVASPTLALEDLFDHCFIEHAAAMSKRPIAEVDSEHRTRADRADNILAPVEMQLNWLRKWGFEHVDCYFKWLELTVFGGVKM